MPPRRYHQEPKTRGPKSVIASFMHSLGFGKEATRRRTPLPEEKQ